MSHILVVLGAICLLQGTVIALSPDTILGAIDWSSQSGQRIASGVRVVSGVLLFIAASASRFPRGLRALGAIVALGGLISLFIPLQLWQSIIDAWIVHPPIPFRLWGSLPNVLLAGVLLYATLPAERGL